MSVVEVPGFFFPDDTVPGAVGPPESIVCIIFKSLIELIFFAGLKGYLEYIAADEVILVEYGFRINRVSDSDSVSILNGLIPELN